MAKNGKFCKYGAWEMGAIVLVLVSFICFVTSKIVGCNTIDAVDGTTFIITMGLLGLSALVVFVLSFQALLRYQHQMGQLRHQQKLEENRHAMQIIDWAIKNKPSVQQKNDSPLAQELPEEALKLLESSKEIIGKIPSLNNKLSEELSETFRIINQKLGGLFTTTPTEDPNKATDEQ
jgi:hypothetical protein